MDLIHPIPKRKIAVLIILVDGVIRGGRSSNGIGAGTSVVVDGKQVSGVTIAADGPGRGGRRAHAARHTDVEEDAGTATNTKGGWLAQTGLREVRWGLVTLMVMLLGLHLLLVLLLLLLPLLLTLVMVVLVLVVLMVVVLLLGSGVGVR